MTILNYVYVIVSHDVELKIRLKKDWRIAKTDSSQNKKQTPTRIKSKGSLKKPLCIKFDHSKLHIPMSVMMLNWKSIWKRNEGSQRLRFMSKQESKVEKLDKKYFCLQFHFVWCLQDLYQLDERSQPKKTFNLYENIFRHFSCPCQIKVQNTTCGM